MPPTTEASSEAGLIRSTINQFLQERLQAKLDKLKEGEDDKRQKLIDEHRPDNWIPDAAHRVSQIQQVTHALKYTHPDAKGTNLSSQGNEESGDLLIGTHSLNGNAPADVVGNAAALDVYKFLRLEINSKSILSRSGDSDHALAAALPGPDEATQSLMAAFASVTEPKGEPTSHKLAKQLYWPLGGGEYHLLAPLFPTALVHGVYQGIREDRFSEAAKSAREARRNKQPHEHGFYEYPNFAIHNYGGTKPQNISQLNSERHGENYLLAAIPPSWKSEPISRPYQVDSIFNRWMNRHKRIYQLTKALRGFLLKVQPVNNIDIRNKRAELVTLIRDEVMQIAAYMQDLPPGWSAHENCKLNIEECCWLDTDRGLDDEPFKAVYEAGHWKDDICHRFGNWLNARLTNDKTPMSAPEHREWSDELKKERRMMREELDSHD